MQHIMSVVILPVRDGLWLFP